MKEEEIIQYIRDNQQFFKTKEALERQLKNAGYKKDEIDSAYAKLLEYGTFDEKVDLDNYEVEERRDDYISDEYVRDEDIDRKVEEELDEIEKRQEYEKDEEETDGFDGVLDSSLKIRGIIAIATILIMVFIPMISNFTDFVVDDFQEQKEIKEKENLKISDSFSLVNDRDLTYSYYGNVIIFPFKYTGSEKIKLSINENILVSGDRECSSYKLENVNADVSSEDLPNDKFWGDENTITFMENHNGILYFKCVEELGSDFNLNGYLEFNFKDFDTNTKLNEFGDLKLKLN